jgi:hypothetical protein
VAEYIEGVGGVNAEHSHVGVLRRSFVSHPLPHVHDTSKSDDPPKRVVVVGM